MSERPGGVDYYLLTYLQELYPLAAMAKTELAASDYRVTSEAALELAEHSFYEQQRESSGALASVATGEDRQNAGEKSALLASEMVSQV